MLFLVLYNNNNSDGIINLAELHLESCGLQTNIWLGCHQRKNGGWTPGLQVESNWNMWGSVKSSERWQFPLELELVCSSILLLSDIVHHCLLDLNGFH